MATTRTPGITIDAAGNVFIDKRHHGSRICLRLGPTTIGARAHRALLSEVLGEEQQNN